ncbi:hypothetical protein FRACA_410036 [Frankia canadensis]|uniref:Uncharacterized protein n=1 Tax=Frankia canadensis TaxID=1836972 RepID=A0A2I2KWY7_9ACTN|nr:hypothetical protein FRACA_410036 [Frankia canadensis]SOU57452.1 hypothetical protein FRACA_410036 [Frankia canadensis]
MTTRCVTLRNYRPACGARQGHHGAHMPVATSRVPTALETPARFRPRIVVEAITSLRSLTRATVLPQPPARSTGGASPHPADPTR